MEKGRGILPLRIKEGDMKNKWATISYDEPTHSFYVSRPQRTKKDARALFDLDKTAIMLVKIKKVKK